MSITPERIAKLNAAEAVLFELGFKQFRVRFHEEVAKIEVRDDEIERFFDQNFMQMIAQKIKEVGFSYVSLDLQGYKMGNMNDSIGMPRNMVHAQ